MSTVYIATDQTLGRFMIIFVSMQLCKYDALNESMVLKDITNEPWTRLHA